MTQYILPHAAAMSEFVSGYNGDCGQTAALAALHVIRGTDLSAANLKALVQRDIAAGRASANGAEPITSIAATLREHGVTYTLYGYKATPGYGALAHQVLLDTFHGSTPGPVILEVANGQALPGDERHLAYHFITVLGIGPEGYYTADGDNPACAKGALVVYTWDQLAAAVPCAMIRCQMPKVTPTPAQTPPPPPPPAPTVAELQATITDLEGQVKTLGEQLAAARALVAKVKELVA